MDDFGIEDYIIKDDAINPFLASMKIRVYEVLAKKKIIDIEGYEVEDGVILPKEGHLITEQYYSFFIEKATSCRIFQEEGVRELCFKLDINAVRLLLYIITHIGKKKQRIRINKVKYMEIADISLKTYYNAVDSLRNLSVIQRFKPNIFWVNPSIIYSGNRAVDFPDKRDILNKYYHKKNGL